MVIDFKKVLNGNYDELEDRKCSFGFVCGHCNILLLQIVELDLSTVTPSLSGPKRPHDRVAVSDMKQDFQECLNNKIGFKGFGIPAEKQNVEVPFTFDGKDFKLSHGKKLEVTNQLFQLFSALSDARKQDLGHSFSQYGPT